MSKLPYVLLVDDDRTTNYLNQLLIKRLDVAETIGVAANGREALTHLQAYCHDDTGQCPVLILLDLNMPVMNGFEFLHHYHQYLWPSEHKAVVVILTTSLHPQDMERVQALHVAGVLSKPLTTEKLQRLLKEHFPTVKLAHQAE
ncbi:MULTISPECIES: response regulator [Hymenobacter]|uniref:Response regulator receiver domain-containing protein n=1 Tax=Hymenobacter mucosus TaxID=1411120 RepID=A0A238V4B4_9BACT|nr:MULTISPECIES: response regulator [Hymenobacter]SNR29332.1 Response regulator receiver domain-containing protein [Hymenobacter mucosus]